MQPIYNSTVITQKRLITKNVCAFFDHYPVEIKI
jgi:hypothetical protein